MLNVLVAKVLEAKVLVLVAKVLAASVSIAWATHHSMHQLLHRFDDVFGLVLLLHVPRHRVPHQLRRTHPAAAPGMHAASYPQTSIQAV